MEDDEYLYVPTVNQQKVISLLFWPSAILSLSGSGLIIYHVLNNRQNRRTAYRRILLVMSVCDVFFSIGALMLPYLAPGGYPNSFVWAIGNHATCSMSGALMQFGVIAQCYSATLALYFVMTIRFGVRQDVFAKRWEPALHSINLTYSIGTAIAGIAMDIFHPLSVGPGCWVACPPDGCHGYTEHAQLIAWIFAGLPLFFSFFTILISNLLLYCHVRKTVRDGERKAMENETQLSTYMSQRQFSFTCERQSNNMSKGQVSIDLAELDGCNLSKAIDDLQGSENGTRQASIDLPQPDSFKLSKTIDDLQQTETGTCSGNSLNLQQLASSKQSLDTSRQERFSWGDQNRRKSSILQSSEKQWSRVRKVGTQSFLYVGVYFLVTIWSFLKQVINRQEYEKVPGSGRVFLPLTILQAIFLPAQGFFTALVFFRPNYMESRKKYHRQSRLWSVRRAIFGKHIKPVEELESTERISRRSSKSARTRINLDLAGEL